MAFYHVIITSRIKTTAMLDPSSWISWSFPNVRKEKWRKKLGKINNTILWCPKNVKITSWMLFSKSQKIQDLRKHFSGHASISPCKSSINFRIQWNITSNWSSSMVIFWYNVAKSSSFLLNTVKSCQRLKLTQVPDFCQWKELIWKIAKIILLFLPFLADVGVAEVMVIYIRWWFVYT